MLTYTLVIADSRRPYRAGLLICAIHRAAALILRALPYATTLRPVGAISRRVSFFLRE